MARIEVPAFEDWVKDRPDVVDLMSRVRHGNETYQRLDNLPEYLGKGRDKTAFRMGDIVVKMLHQRAESPFSQQLNALKKSLGIRGVEQVVAQSPRSRVLVTEFMTGVMPAKISTERLLRYIRPETAQALVETTDAMTSAGVFAEGPLNLLASTEGFKVIDPSGHCENGITVQEYGEVANIIATYGWSDDTDWIAPRGLSDVSWIRSAFMTARNKP